ncbi:MAG: hypothetical protein M3477_00065 [Gemmatimonadota bacterium]|nr:hypothetical protein [Gemmatimonadota bacterium]
MGALPLAGALVALPLLALHSSPLAAQAWNSPDAAALVRRAVERRVAVQADSTLRSYRARAHGFVFFLAQVGEGLTQPPRLVKADELDVEVYWQAPDRSKQVILGWRDGTFLPTDINYHRDHLGIVTNNFGDVIRIGEGDEVRDVGHPLSPGGLLLYDYALGDSLAIRTGRGEISVREVQARPRSFARPLVVGTLYLDAASAELVRFRFSFTPAAYLDRQLEDISIVLENALYEGSFWLPYRQEVEIRRRVSWLDFPARGIIRGRWEIEEYDLNLALPPGLFSGPPIAGLRRPVAGDTTWSEPLERAIADVAAPLNRQDMDELRVEVERIARARALGGLPSNRLATGSLSDLIRVNRVQGLTLGFGGVVGLEGSRLQLRPQIAYGTSDERITGELTASVGSGGTRLTLGAGRQIRDLSDLAVISPALNSILAQEGGKDLGDYVLLHTAGGGVRHRVSGRTTLGLDLEVQESRSVAVAAEPANGSYEPNPALGAGTYRTARLSLERASGGIAVRRDLQGRVALEAGEGPSDYVRGTLEGRWLASLGGSELLSRVYLGAGNDGLPAHRSFVIGGRGTLVGEPFRAYGGRTAALAHLEWRLEVPAPAIPLGSFASTGRTLTLAPFVAAGYAERPISGVPWRSSGGVRPVAGVAVEWFMRLLRVEAGIGLRDGRVGLTVDINRDWWGLL